MSEVIPKQHKYYSLWENEELKWHVHLTIVGDPCFWVNFAVGPGFDEAETTWIEGHVKFDGCNEVGGLPHMCDGVASYRELTEAVVACFRLAHEAIDKPMWDNDTATPCYVVKEGRT